MREAQNESGVSRDEMAAALMDVTAGRVPRDRLSLRELYKEMISWPFLDEDPSTSGPAPTASPYEEITDTGGLPGSNHCLVPFVVHMPLHQDVCLLRL